MREEALPKSHAWNRRASSHGYAQDVRSLSPSAETPDTASSKKSGVTHATVIPKGSRMSLEFWSTVASIATFFVIAATAAAALVQLRHMRASNQIAALSDISRQIDSEWFRTARRALQEQLPRVLDAPEFRARAATEPNNIPELDPVRTVAGMFESLGSFVKFRALDAGIVIDQFGDAILDAWKELEPVIRLTRSSSPFLWENFEYLVVLTEDFVASHPNGSYPKGVRRKA